MMKSIPSLFTILISSLVIFTQTNANIAYAESSGKGLRSTWGAEPHRNRIELFKKWLENKPIGGSASGHAALSPYDVLHPTHQFKGCIDPSEPFQCPQSEKCIALQFICDGHPGDCPGNLDENEETCIAAKRPAKENIEKFLQSEYILHGSKLFTFLFGHKISKSIEENNTFWFDTLASAYSEDTDGGTLPAPLRNNKSNNPPPPKSQPSVTSKGSTFNNNARRNSSNQVQPVSTVSYNNSVRANYGTKIGQPLENTKIHNVHENDDRYNDPSGHIETHRF